MPRSDRPGVGIGAAAWAGDHDAAAASSDGGGSMMGGTMDDAHGSTMTEPTFVEEMVPHHESALQMAQMALAKGNSPEVRGLATRSSRPSKSRSP